SATQCTGSIQAHRIFLCRNIQSAWTGAFGFLYRLDCFADQVKDVSHIRSRNIFGTAVCLPLPGATGFDHCVGFDMEADVRSPLSGCISSRFPSDLGLWIWSFAESRF